MHLIGDVCLPSALLLDPMLFLRDLLVHSGVAPGRAKIAHGIEVIRRHFAEQVAHGSTQHPRERSAREESRGFRLRCRAFRVSADGVGAATTTDEPRQQDGRRPERMTAGRRGEG